MTLKNRPFSRDTDWKKAVDFLHPAVEDKGDHWKWLLASARAKFIHMHSGYHQIWTESTGEIVALSKIEPLAGFFMVLCKPQYRTRAIFNQIVSHAEDVLRLLSEKTYFLTSTYEEEDPLSQVLVERGYAVEECCALYMGLEIDASYLHAHGEEEFCVRPMNDGDESETDRWIEMIAHAFNPRLHRISLELQSHYRQYHKFCKFADRGNIELIAVSDDGVIASSASVDIDPVNGVGEFEEVGTLIEYRRRGLARRVMLVGIDYMARQGVGKVLVRPHPKNEAAIRLYEGIGFETVDRLRGYRRMLSR